MPNILAPSVEKYIKINKFIFCDDSKQLCLLYVIPDQIQHLISQFYNEIKIKKVSVKRQALGIWTCRGC